MFRSRPAIVSLSSSTSYWLGELSTRPLSAAVRSRTRLDVRVGVSGEGTRCEAGDDAPASVGVHGLQGRELRLMQPTVFLANMSLALHSAPETRVPAREARGPLDSGSLPPAGKSQEPSFSAAGKYVAEIGCSDRSSLF